MGGEDGSQDMAEMADRQAGIDRLSYKVTDTLGDIAYRGDLEALNARLDRGDDPNDPQQSFSGAAPLFCAARYGHPACVASLLARNADVAVAHPEAGSALHGAAGSGHADIVRLLLAAGAPPNALDSGGDSALTLAAYSGHTAVLRLLLDAGADAAFATPSTAPRGHVEAAALLRGGPVFTSKTAVLVRGLVTAAHHNGKTGLVRSFDEAAGRYVVVLPAVLPVEGKASGEPSAVLKIKPANLERAPAR
eukprot:CAMPEP_0194402886 /NCGR_PEP_ID=MMETSP0176-20130528/1548_1 /TAXON_ID=216777 /ORGANISM="Proboscia alata, Strain PI-D3" /LENGTH=248 /DNA_ID=CAMNT_0039200449 /DNA_START=30 /DNA_END=777 /DNA_ORIENTATION=+